MLYTFDASGEVCVFLGCTGTGCKRTISVGSGNPTAFWEPEEEFAFVFRICGRCEGALCDVCMARRTAAFGVDTCPKCGAELQEPDIEALLSGVGPAAAAATEADFNACFSEGHRLNREGRPVEALAEFQKAAALWPHRADVHHCRAVLLQQLGSHDAALSAYNDALRLNRFSADVWFNKAQLLMLMRRPDAAIAAYDMSIQVDPNFLNSYVNKAWLLSDMGRNEEALAALDQGVRIDTGGEHSARLHGNRGAVLTELERYEEALESIDRALSLNPDSYGDTMNRGNVLERLGRVDEARSCFQRADELKPR
ncbi:tetratricopeptide repeat protein [Spirillospora sp. NPDC052269]